MSRIVPSLALGLDFGTSGCRAIVLDEQDRVQAELTHPLPAPRRDGKAVEQSPLLWAEALHALLAQVVAAVPAQAIGAIAVDGTSGTVLLADAQCAPLGPALLYNDGRAMAQAERLRQMAPRDSAAHGIASGLAKLLWLLEQPQARQAAHVLTPADYLNAQLLGRCAISDANNVLKLGYDPLRQGWPAWLDALGVPRAWLPRVVRPGTPLGAVTPDIARRYGLRPDTLVAAGTTDGTAAFLATGAARPGEAVTSLGSTLVVKVIAERPIFAPEYGIYSQPLGSLWLVGGGSNSGGAVLRQFFDDAQMAALTTRLDPTHPTGLDYYPLAAPGERFPLSDPQLAPRLTPRPADDALFFQGLLEGIAAIEARGYRLLAELGAPWPVSVRSVGGGARNPAWSAIRARLLGVPLLEPLHTEAAYGTARLARYALTERA